MAVMRRMISKDAENKHIGWNVENNVQHNSAIGSADCEPLVQEIAQGLTSQSRVGDRVKPKSLKVSGVVSFNPDDCTTSQNIYARVVIVAQKNIKVGSQVTGGGVDAAHLLRPGLLATPEKAFQGNTIDLNYPINKDLFRVYYDRTFLLSSGVVTGGSVETQPLYSKRWSYRFKQLPASLTYDAGNGNWANNFAPFVAIGYAFSDGSSPDTITTRLISNTYSLLEFEDA